jgi:thiol-disulfide isomerase/thioredoxin
MRFVDVILTLPFLPMLILFAAYLGRSLLNTILIIGLLSWASTARMRKLMQGKKLVMVVYFAPWCPNWRNEAPVAASLYEKYKDQGFGVIGVSEYGTRDDVKNYFGPNGAPYPVVSESETREDRDKTSHFGYRQLTGDTRKWGSPWNIFLQPASVAKTGDVLTEKAWVVNGELILADVDKFIADQLKTTTASVIVPCKE